MPSPLDALMWASASCCAADCRRRGWPNVRRWWQAGADIRAAPTRRRKAVFLHHSLSRSRPLEQAKKQTDGPQTRVNPRLRALNAQEGSREQREKNGGMRARNGYFRRGVLKRPRPETAPTQGERAKKSQPDKGWDFTLWWRRGELNPCPQALRFVIYVCIQSI
jgi:hypothetical protein